MSVSAQPFRHDPVLGREIRTGSAEELGVPTDTLLLDALRSGDREQAGRLFDYAMLEAEQILRVLVTWVRSLLEFGEEQTRELAAARARLEDAIGGPPPLIDAAEIAAERANAARAAIDSAGAEEAEAAVRAAREEQWDAHDALCDWVWGLLTAFRDELGEDRMEEVYRATLEEWMTARYAKLGELSQREMFELTIEGMRGHFCGTGHSGVIEVDEDEDTWVLSFDPCGSGGRMRRGDPELGQTPRTEPPFSFGVTERAHDWSWKQEGVCLYCAHCSVCNEILPIERLGAPMRTTEYPKTPDDRCRWIVYKDTSRIPESAYTRVGLTPPS